MILKKKQPDNTDYCWSWRVFISLKSKHTATVNTANQEEGLHRFSWHKHRFTGSDNLSVQQALTAIFWNVGLPVLEAAPLDRWKRWCGSVQGRLHHPQWLTSFASTRHTPGRSAGLPKPHIHPPHTVGGWIYDNQNVKILFPLYFWSQWMRTLVTQLEI